MFCPHRNFLERLKTITRHSGHPHEQTAFSLVCELEELAENDGITRDELALITGKAADIMTYFKYDFESLAHESSWYRACVIHQMSCGILQAIAMLRPNLNANNMLSESAYYLYCQPLQQSVSPAKTHMPGPVTCRRWYSAENVLKT